MSKDRALRFRMTDAEEAKLSELAKMTKRSKAAVLRVLLEMAQLTGWQEMALVPPKERDGN